MTKPLAYCKGCDYDLSGSTAMCPECGRGFATGDPRTYRTFRRTSLMGRLRRWGWAMAVTALLVGLWPRGWVLMRVAWRDAGGASTAEASALMIGRPWWLGGWWPPLATSSTSGPPAPVPEAGSITPITFVSKVRRSASVLPWREEPQTLGRFLVDPIAPGRRPTPAEWSGQLETFARAVALSSIGPSGNGPGMAYVVPPPDWTKE